MDFSNYHIEEDVYILSPIISLSTTEYIAVRRKENRILNDKQVKELPFTSSDNQNHKEWQLRQKSAIRFLKYVKNKNTSLTILDLGCGNGWFSNKIAAINQTLVVGLDVNNIELKQASKVFKKANLKFIFHNVFATDKQLNNKFDIIVLNASVQYFSDFKILISTIKKFLKYNGEIHILDSPFYDASEIEAAKKRTEIYYTKLGFSKMSEYYHHHSKDNINNFDVLYQPKKTKFKKLFGLKDSPFLWIRQKN